MFVVNHISLKQLVVNTSARRTYLIPQIDIDKETSTMDYENQSWEKYKAKEHSSKTKKFFDCFHQFGMITLILCVIILYFIFQAFG